MSLRLALGISDFRELRMEGWSYVDKSLLIRDLIDDGSKVLLLPRPRRFGKTLNLSMLRYYFERPPHGQAHSHAAVEDRWTLFQDLAIAQQDPRYRTHFQRYPTIFLTFKDLKADSWPACLALTGKLLAQLYRDHVGLLPGLLPSEARTFQAVLDGAASPEDLSRSLLDLTLYLQRQHGERVLVLLDEYDTPLNTAYTVGYYKEALTFFRNLLSAALKDNSALHKGVLTGVLRLAKASIFTGLNNLAVYSTLSERFSTAFGFTQSEVEDLLRRGGLLDRLPEVARWYNGYLFGGQVIYNPWSVLSYLNYRPALPLPYWGDTSSNDLVRELLVDHGVGPLDEWQQLLQGGTIERVLSENVALPDLAAQPGLIWSVLWATGYLKVISRRLVERKIWATLAIPNEEVRGIFETRFSDWLTARLGGDHERDEFLAALLRGDAVTVQHLLSGWLLRSASFHDTAQVAQPERFYHGLVLGLLVSLGSDYEVRSNLEVGHGRCDILIAPRRPDHSGVVLELKVADRSRRETLAGALRAAQAQLVDRDYGAGLRARFPGIGPVHELAIAWSGKEVLVTPARPARPAKPRPARSATPAKPRPARPATPAKPRPARPAKPRSSSPDKPAPKKPRSSSPDKPAPKKPRSVRKAGPARKS